MRKTIFLGIIFCWCFQIGIAQEQSDSLLLNDVIIYGIPNKSYIVGQKVVEVDSSQKEMYRFNTLAEMLSVTTPVYLKSYGNNMLSTISFRGTGANHTAVLWNGFNINSPTSGQTDFSLIPLNSADEIYVHYGSASALAGSGALGGSIHLNSQPEWGKGYKLSLGQSVGSFGSNGTQLLSDYSDDHWQFKTKAYYKQSDNDFEYYMPIRKTEIKQNNAAYTYFGFNQEINHKISSSQQLLFNAWFNNNDRELQPTNGNLNNNDEQQDRSLRLAASYHNNSKVGYFIYRLGYLNDYLNYNRSSSITKTGQLLNAISYEKNVSKYFRVKSGVMWNHINADVDGYGDDKQEDRYDIYALMLYKEGDWEAGFNVRQNIVSGYNSPLAPSVSVAYLGIDNIKFDFQASRNYRIPTLNDRYWDPGGNLSLKPEDSYNVEVGMAYTEKRFSFNLNVYKMWVEDWIIWIQESSYWTPNNLRKVHAQGLELSASYGVSFGKLNLKSSFIYSYNQTENVDAVSAGDVTVGHQLAYTPKHRLTYSLQANRGSWYGQANVQYTGMRYTVGHGEMDPFGIIDLQLGKRFKWNEHTFNLAGKINNLADQEYVLLENRAMPGVNYELNLVYNFK
ncbi:TonB-dependent receptor [Fulvivirga sediminis]|uniref:TonB-dependent receptor n=1 Tax=Fulvivirga sediminis TaxID=2803949 RepID=A0A937F6C4_9BACT|nr:TonB-dependent receptor [Fulvivirga sediminis]MBL3655069.1 TonB-dependent receptor [Fulvivirga sediminis]